MNKQGTQQSLILWFWPIVAVVLGVLLLLHNFLLLEVDILQYWPVLLILLGLQVLIRGDLGFSWASQSFGITRGSVESGTLRVNSGELDMRVHALQREGRLIAGEYTARSRPSMNAVDNHVTLSMLRSETWPLSMADWNLGVADDLPWDMVLSSFLGEIEVDLRRLIVGETFISTGFGNIRAFGPESPSGQGHIHSTFGDIYLTIPDTIEAAIIVQGGPFFGIHLQSDRWQRAGKRYTTPGYQEAIEPLEFTVSGTFGDLFLT